MSGQDYVYIVWLMAGNTYLHNQIKTTKPTKYEAKLFIDHLPKSDVYRIQRWRHGDTEGHWCD